MFQADACVGSPGHEKGISVIYVTQRELAKKYPFADLTQREGSSSKSSSALS